MRVIFGFFAILFLSLACASQPNSVSPEALNETSKSNAAACNDESFCTREYLPTSCQFGGQTFEGGNPCEAKKLAKRYACERNLPFTDASTPCTPKQAKPVAAATDCAQRSYCTMEMNPHSCVFNGEKFRGSNRCDALQKVRAFACERGLAMEEKNLVCEPVKNSKEKAG